MTTILATTIFAAGAIIAVIAIIAASVIKRNKEKTYYDYERYACKGVPFKDCCEKQQ